MGSKAVKKYRPKTVFLGDPGLVQQGDQTIEARKGILKKQREQLVIKMEEIQQTLDLVDHKIEVYENAVLQTEKEIIPIEN